MKGILLIDKPTDWTSFDVVNYVRKMVARIENKKPRNVKVGHTGTLDPAATGLLVLCVGREFTKQVPTMIKHDKTYEVELTLGKTSTTGDREGELSVLSDMQPASVEVEVAIQSFLGESMQLPPKFSALKVNGKRAYELARAGKEVTLQPRKITIHELSDISYDYPKVTFTASVGSGTYIRSLAEDIGTKLGTGAYMSSLRRVAVGDKNIAQAVAVSDLTDELLQKTLVD
jgi:tRNA pseudouridine55 synthase